MKALQFLRTLLRKKESRDIAEYSAKEIVELMSKWLEKENGNRQIIMSVMEGEGCHSMLSKDGETLSLMLYSILNSDIGEFFVSCFDKAMKKYLDGLNKRPLIPFNPTKYKS